MTKSANKNKDTQLKHIDIPKSQIEKAVNGNRSVNGDKVTTLYGFVEATLILEASLDTNLRICFLEAENKAETKVHKGMAKTLHEDPELFTTYNKGVYASASRVKEFKDFYRFYDVKIGNGAQTLGVIRAYREYCFENDYEPKEVVVKVEMAVCKNEDLTKQAAIHMNIQNAVKTLSILGILGKFDELESVHFEKVGQVLRKSETDPHESADTGLGLQNVYGHMPQEIYSKNAKLARKGMYAGLETNLNRFEDAYENSKNKQSKTHAASVKEYNYILNTFTDSLILDSLYRNHEGWLEAGIDVSKNNGRMKPVNRALCCALISAHRAIATEVGGVWKLNRFSNDVLIKLMKHVAKHYKAMLRKSGGKSRMSDLARSEIVYTEVYELALKLTKTKVKTKRKPKPALKASAAK